MKQKVRSLPVIFPFLIFLFFIGCYEVPYAVDVDQRALIRDEFLGDWKRDSTGTAAHFETLKITRPLDSPWYHYDLTNVHGHKQEMKAIFHQIGDSTIISVTRRDGSQREYSIFRLVPSESDSSRLVVQGLDEDAPRFNSVAKFRAFLSSRGSEHYFPRKLVFLKAR